MKPQVDDQLPLEPVTAHRQGERCHLCHLYIVTGDPIVTSDGTQYAHRDCAEANGWEVA